MISICDTFSSHNNARMGGNFATAKNFTKQILCVIKLFYERAKLIAEHILLLKDQTV